MAQAFIRLFLWIGSAGWLVNAGEFLAANPETYRQRWGAGEVSAELVQEVVAAQVANKKGNKAFQKELLSMYRALPKNQHGLLDAATARYALHRFFVHKYGWYVRGLDPRGESWTKSTNTMISKNRLAQHVQSLFVREAGLDLADLATFASVLSALMEEEVDAGLEEIFNALEIHSSNISNADFDLAVESYLARFIVGGDTPIRNKVALKDVMTDVRIIYREWPNTASWARDVVRTHDWLERDENNPFVRQVRTQASAIANVRGMMHRFNHLSAPECFSVKRELMEKEDAGTGRVRLVDFYSDFHRKRESIPYLRNLGVLDESDPDHPALLIPNFVTSTTNCLVDSSYYSSCCPNECEHLMSHLERVVSAPEASPGLIVDVVSHMPSHTVDAPRNLSSTLLGKLQGIADQHGGTVPLSGRLFAQWMHHAYPRECPFPQQSGTFKPLTQDEFMDVHLDLDDVFVTKKQIEGQMKKWRSSASPARTTDALPWDTAEELVAKHHRDEWKLGGLRPFVVVVAFASMVWPLAKSSSIFLRGGLVQEKTVTHLV